MAIEKKIESWGPFWSYQLNCTANSANMANFCCKWANEWTKNLSNFFDKSVDKKAFLKITNLYAPTFPNHSYYIYSLYKRDKRCQIGIRTSLKSAYKGAFTHGTYVYKLFEGHVGGKQTLDLQTYGNHIKSCGATFQSLWLHYMYITENSDPRFGPDKLEFVDISDFFPYMDLNFVGKIIPTFHRYLVTLI